MSNWRSDPDWKLVEYDQSKFKEPPGDRPHDQAELAQPPIWASLYHEGRIAATWSRARNVI